MAPRPDFRAELRITPGSRVRLERRDHGASYGWERAAAEIELAKQLERLADLQDTPPARTGPSTRSWRRSTPRAAR
jgi:hypothetical protein